MARPTKLTPALIKKAREYDFVELKQAVPTIEGLALYLDISRETIYDWCSTNEGSPGLYRQFSDIVSRLMATQGLELVNNGLRGRFNAKIANMMLSKHGYVEKSQQDLTTNGKDLPVPILGGTTNKGGDDE